MNASWYDVLDVEPTASAEEIRVAWRAAVAELDPTDRRFRVFNQAAEVLMDPAKRAAYDAELERGRSVEGEPRRNDRSETEASLLARTHGRSLPLVPGWLLVGLAVLTAASLVFMGIELAKPSPARIDSDAAAAQAAAERAIVPILSYDYRHLAESSSQATPLMTPGEQAQYAKLFAVIKQNAPHTGTVVKASYVASGIVRTGSGRADVLVFVNQSTTNKQHLKSPVIYKNQVTVSMEKVGNDWLVDNLVTGAGTG